MARDRRRRLIPWVPVRLLVLPVALILVLAGCGSASVGPSTATVRATTSTTAAAATTATTAAATTVAAGGHGQSLRQVWLFRSTTVWAWTQALSGQAQGLERSTDGGQHWTDVTPPGMSEQVGDHFINGFFALDADNAWVVYGGIGSSAAQTVAATSDGGHHWTVVGRRPDTYGCDLQFVSPSDGWCAAIGGAAGSESVKLYRTEDGGTHWRVVSNTGPAGNPPGSLPFGCDKDIQFASPNVGWAIFACAGGVAPLYETTNGGATWVRRDVTAPSGSLEGGSGFAGSPVLAGANGAVGYTISGPAPRTVVYVSTDAGASWHPLTPPGRAQAWLVDAMTPLVWRLFDGDRILATDNGGQSWREITSDVGFKLYYTYDSPTPPVVDFVTDEVGWVVSTSLWRTTDEGRTWRRLAVPGT